MKKSNVILQAAIAGALFAIAGAAQAGTLTGATTFAAENFGPTATAALAIKPTTLVYTFNTSGGIVVNPGGTVYLYERIAGGLFSTVPLTAQYQVSNGIIGLTVTPTLSADSTTVRLALNNPTTNNITIGIGGTVTWTPITGAISSVNTTLATAGGSVTATASVNSVAVNAPNTGTALPADLDNGVSASHAFATAAEAITSAVVASSAFTVVETQKIDLTATSPGSRFTSGVSTTSTVLANLGSVTFTDAANTQALIDGATDYTIAGRGTATTFSGTVTGSFKTGSTMILATNLACTAAITTGSAGVLNTGLTSFTFSAGTLPTTAVPYYVCLGAPATTGAIPVTTPTASFTFTKTTTTDAADTASGTLYALTQNGATKDVRNYVPAATLGYTGFVRVINTGSVAAAITGQWIYENGTISTAATLISSHPAAGSVTMTSAQIEAALGAPTAIGGNRPRLRLTAPTNGLEAMGFVRTDFNSTFGDFTGGQ